MAVPGIPQNLYVQQANRQVYLLWDITSTALSYSVERSLDGVTFSVVATPSLNNYLDSTVSSGTLYYYKVAAVNGSGTGTYTAAQMIIPSPTGEMSLAQIRQAAQQRADLVNSQFVTLPEWNSYINQSYFELYDLLVTLYEPHFFAIPVVLTTNGNTYLYSLPDGVSTFINGITNASNYLAPPFYKLQGVDLALNNASNAWVTVNKFVFEERNQYLYPNSASTIYGVFNMKYRQIGQTPSGVNQIEFIPTPSGNQQIRIWYVPRLNQLLQETDITIASISGWIEYVIVDAAIKAMQKEESDVSVLAAQKMALMKRITDSASNIDANQPDRISNIRTANDWGNGSGWGYNGPIGGF